MSTIVQQLQDAADKATQASSQANTWANGPEFVTVPTESGPVPTIAEFNRKNQATVDAHIINLGFTRIGTFAVGATLDNPRQTLLWAIADGGDGQEYGWSGAFPKVVPPSSTPLTTGGISVGAWISRFDSITRIQAREAVRRSYAEAGYALVSGSFEVGGILSTSTDALLYEASGKAYVGSGPFPQTVPAGTSPASSGFVIKDLSSLRGELAAVDGINLVGGALYSQFRTYAGDATRMRCLGRTNIFDGADGEFARGSSLSAIDDDATVLVDALGRPWYRLNIKEALPEWWGALGDGVADDGVEINKAISFAETRCFSVYFQRDAYLTGIPLIVKTGTGLTLRGNNKGRTTITKTALTAPNITRTYNGATFDYSTPCIFALIADDESYVRHIRMSNINLTGLNNDITQTHIFAPRATYSVWENILSSSGRSFFEARLGGFVNTFINCRSALMAIHWDVEGGNAYSLYNTYANGTISGSPSEGYRFKDTNVNFHGADTDGLNVGYLALGITKMSLFGCNTEARLRQVNARDNSSVDVHGGRYGLTMIGSQAASPAACFWTEGSGKIDVYSVKAYKFDFTGGSPTNKYLAIASSSSRITLNDVDLDITNTTSAVAFTEADIVSNNEGKAELLRAGKTINFAANHRLATDFGTTTSKQIRKSLDFASNTAQTLLTLSGADYNEVIIGEISVMYRSTGNNGQGSVSGTTQLKITGSNRNTATVNLQQVGSQLCPDGQTGTITFAASITGGVATITATASTINVGVCFCLIDVKGTVVMANGESDYMVIS